jgi:hypothetical protein
MQQYWPRVTLAGLVVVLLALPGAAPGETPKADPAAQKAFDKLLDAIKAKDREAFVADATDAVKRETTPEAMDALDKHVGSRLRGGYEAAYLGQLKKGTIRVHLWKLAFKDGGDDLVALMALADGKVGSLHFQ